MSGERDLRERERERERERPERETCEPNPLIIINKY